MVKPCFPGSSPFSHRAPMNPLTFLYKVQRGQPFMNLLYSESGTMGCSLQSPITVSSLPSGLVHNHPSTPSSSYSDTGSTCHPCASASSVISLSVILFLLYAKFDITIHILILRVEQFSIYDEFAYTTRTMNLDAARIKPSVPII